MSDTMRTILLFIISTVFDIYLFILMIRLILAWVQADYYNPLTQFVITCTSFIIKPLRQIIPNYKRLETATLVVIIILALIKFLIILPLSFGFPNFFGLSILAFADIIKLALETFFYAILLQAIVSWIQPSSNLSQVLVLFTSPILRPFQRLIPPIAGLDLSPIPVLIILQLIIILLINPLMAKGLGIAIG